ncbi:MAG: hypothetical protein V4516_01405 [Pseudomonadota bacterium]
MAGLAVSTAWAETPLVALPPLADDAEALPRLGGASPAAARVNARLAELDAQALVNRKACLSAGAGSDWARWVDVRLFGSNILSLTIQTSFYCAGAAHPSSYLEALTLDLATGDPVGWTQVFPASYQNPEQWSFPSQVLRGSLRLTALYVAANGTIDAECSEVIAGVPHDFHIYASAEDRALVMVPDDLPHAEQACADPVAIPVATLRGIGVVHPVLDALVDD